jgi:hypothetical protein
MKKKGNCLPWSVGRQDLQDGQDKTIAPIGRARFEGMAHAKTQSRKGKSATLHHAIKNLALLAAWRERDWPVKILSGEQSRRKENARWGNRSLNVCLISAKVGGEKS